MLIFRIPPNNPAREITRESLHEIGRGEGGRHAEIHTFIKHHNISLREKTLRQNYFNHKFLIFYYVLQLNSLRYIFK